MGKMYLVSTKKDDKLFHASFAFLLLGNWSDRNSLGLLYVKVLAAVLVFPNLKKKATLDSTK